MNIRRINAMMDERSPEEIAEWALGLAKNPVITTNFRPYESAILHLVTRIAPSIDVLWCDTGYNTEATYQHAIELIKLLELNIHIYVPKQTVGYRNALLGIPQVGTPAHELFSQQVKMEPFGRAMDEFSPDVWFTNLRAGQTAFRNQIGVISKSAGGVVKVSPFYHFSDKALGAYLEKHKLPNETDYFDPTKVFANRECGIHH